MLYALTIPIVLLVAALFVIVALLDSRKETRNEAFDSQSRVRADRGVRRPG